MRSSYWIPRIFGLCLLVEVAAITQTRAKNANPARLELTMEVSTRNDDGSASGVAIHRGILKVQEATARVSVQR